jgi:hypothetical protein
MNAWQERFAQKMATLRSASHDRFNTVVSTEISAAFQSLEAFATEQHLQCTTPLAGDGVSTFKFELDEDSYALVTFRLDRMDECHALTELAIPKSGKKSLDQTHRKLVDVDAEWSTSVFQRSLDALADALIESFASAPNATNQVAQPA